MNFLEKDLEDIIYQTDNKFLEERGLLIKGLKFRQVRIGNYGIADLITLKRHTSVRYCTEKDNPDGYNIGDVIDVYNPATITIYELKKGRLDMSHIGQVMRYAKGVERYFSKSNNNIGNIYFDDIEIRMCLIGSSMNQGDFTYMEHFIPELDIFTYRYDYDGIHFTLQENYVLRDEGFDFIF